LKRTVTLCILALALHAVPAPAEDAPPPVNFGANAGEAPPPASVIVSDGGTAIDIFFKGGWSMWPIAVCGVIGLIFFFDRVIGLRRKKHAPPGLDKDVVHVVDTRGVDAGLAFCLEKQSSLTRVCYAALLRYGTSRQEMEGAVQNECTRLLFDLRRNVRWIGFMTAMTPLLGVLGTVLSLIGSLDTMAVNYGMGTMETVAAAGAIALLPMAFALIITIPLLAMYLLARMRADDIVREISERGVDTIITLDRKARRSMRLIEDIEEHLETQEMVAAKAPPDLDMEIDEGDKALKSSVTTPAQLPAMSEGSITRKGSTHGEIKAAQPPREGGSSSGTELKKSQSAQ